MAAACAASCSASPGERLPPAPVTVTIGAPQTRNLGPARSIRVFAQGLSVERLSAFDSRARPIPRLLESWTTSPDGLTWRLRLRDNIFFQDGTPLSASDVKAAIERAIGDPNVRDPAVCLRDVSGVAVDGRDIVVSLTRRCYYLLDDLDTDISRTSAGNRTVGTGPFAIESLSDESVNLAANERYHGGRPTIDRVTIRAYDTLRTAWAEMLRGRVDFLWEVGPDTTEFLSAQSSVDVLSYPVYFCPSIVFNLKRPGLRPAVVRQALSLAVDRQELVRHALKGQGRPASSPVWPNYWALPADAPEPPFDRARARTLLASSPRVRFTCILMENFTVFERLALIVQQQLREVGVDMRLESLPAREVFDRIGRGDYDAALINPLGGPYAVVHHRLWHSPDPWPRWNTWNYSNTAVDAALDAMRDAPDDDRYRQAVAAFVTAVLADPPAMFLVWPGTAQALSRRFVLPDGAAGRDALAVLARWRPRGEAVR